MYILTHARTDIKCEGNGIGGEGNARRMCDIGTERYYYILFFIILCGLSRFFNYTFGRDRHYCRYVKR